THSSTSVLYTLSLHDALPIYANLVAGRPDHCRFPLFDFSKRLLPNSILQLRLGIGGERGAESNRAMPATHPNAHFASAPFPIHCAESGRKSFHTHRQIEPLLRDAGADDERWFIAGFVEAGEHIELEQQHLGGGPVMRRDVRRRDPTPRLFPTRERVFFTVAFPPGEQARRRLVVPEPAQISR